MQSICTPELAHYLWSHLCNTELDSDGMRGEEDEGAFATVYDVNCEYCDVCDSRVRRLAFECRSCDYGECYGSAKNMSTQHSCDGRSLPNCNQNNEPEPNNTEQGGSQTKPEYWEEFSCGATASAAILGGGKTTANRKTKLKQMLGTCRSS